MEETVKLSVGGYLYTTLRSTVTRYPESMLGAMFSGRIPSVREADGSYFIDGDGSVFRHVLNYLRRSKLDLPEDFQDWDLLATEADYYQIEDLKKAVETAKEERVTEGIKEFIELTAHQDSAGLISGYRGSLNTRHELESLDKSIQVITCEGNYHAFYLPTCPKRLEFFGKLSKLGFKLNTSWSIESQLCWTFSRKIKN